MKYNIFSFIDPADLEFDLPSSLPNLGVYKVGLHLIQILTAVLVLVTTAPIISIEKRYQGWSQGAPNFSLTITIISFFLSAALAAFPWSKITTKNSGLLKRFFLRPRTNVIFTCFMTTMWFIAMICMSVHSTRASNCEINPTLEKKYEHYASSWKSQCHCAKASAVFCWLSFFAWLATTVHSAILLWHEKKLRHAEHEARMAKRHEDDNQTAVSSNPYDEDALTIVDMKYSEKDGQPIVNYNNPDSIAEEEEDSKNHVPTASMSPTHPAPTVLSHADNSNFVSPFSPTMIAQQPTSPHTTAGHYVTSSPYSSPHYSVTNTAPTYPSPYSNYVASPPPLNAAAAAAASPYQSPYNALSTYTTPSTNVTPYTYHQATTQFANTATYPPSSPTTYYAPATNDV
ncbi:uncharacterized protein BX663DRAFT_485083 [Cokeromyces recurvatus]|uniref:uncharacterized protein n=1 Tax=Cokeromyces recurvatus TaxID=90255 RepID=UPI00221EB4F3|nr:uncharacterized protein BX663DRAFT_485083 [Cokeromyces recurvatus]KAI7904251.1 hypothetical protein BX663DRAFT_485083 [Cokeromyces recurvatus]